MAMLNLSKQIKKYAEQNPVRFHTPGHKGALEPHDVTELFFTDNLYSPNESLRFILDLEERIPQVFFPRRNIASTISCGGATLCIQAALLAVSRKNRENNKNNNNDETGTGRRYIICARDCHISFINALALLDIEPIWLYDTGCIEELFKINRTPAREGSGKNIIAAFVTSPNYYGGMCDIAKISKVCKKYDTPLIVDNAHGSHLAFHKDGELHPVNCGADIAIDSVHKTLPALTGAALAHAVPGYDMRGAMQVFASTSPSYLILQSIEQMLDFLETSGTAEHCRLLDDITGLKNNAREYFAQEPAGDANPWSDPFRIILNCENSGGKLYYFLFEKNITCEFYENDRVIIVPSVFNKSSDFESLAGALQIFTRENNVTNVTSVKIPAPLCGVTRFSLPAAARTLSQTLKSPREPVNVSAALGRICAEPVFAYPPGIPLVLPGEIISRDIIDIITNANANLARGKIHITCR